MHLGLKGQLDAKCLPVLILAMKAECGAKTLRSPLPCALLAWLPHSI